MKSASKTKKELIAELEALRDRVSDLERQKRNSRQALGNSGEIARRSYAQMAYMHEAMFVIFDRKLEFINDKFAELFGVLPEEACSCNFDPMTLIAPESRPFIQEVYRAGCRGSFAAKEVKYTGMSKAGLKIECETFFLFIPYKWGVSMQGTLHGISVSRRIDDEMQRRYCDLRVEVKAGPTGVLYSDRDHLFLPTDETVAKSNGLPMEQIPFVDYSVTLPIGATL
jgi:PAS domain-containing protein